MNFITLKNKYFRYALSLAIVIGLSIPLQSFGASISDIPSNFTFEKTMYPNNRYDPDVKYLQLLLNADSRTRVAETGFGSNEAPTTYYGSKTKDAVNRFQMLYKDEVLTPIGLSAPTGIVGPKTRSKLNQLLSILINQSNNTQSNTSQNYQNNSQNPVSQNNTQSSNTNTSVGTTSTSTPPTNTSNSQQTSTSTNQNSSSASSNSNNTQSSSGTSGSTSNAGSNTSSGSTGTTGSNSSNISSGSSGSGSSAGGAAVGAGVSAGSSALGSTGTTGGSGSSGLGHFGGTISNVTYCTCSVSVLLDINDYTTGYVSLLYTPGVSTLYSNYNIFTSGPYVLGGYTQGGAQCLVISGTSCTTQGSPTGIIDNIRGIGSSAY